MGDYTKVRHSIGFGRLWKSAADIAETTGIDIDTVKAEIDAVKRAHNVSTRNTNGVYEYAMTARIKA